MIIRFEKSWTVVIGSEFLFAEDEGEKNVEEPSVQNGDQTFDGNDEKNSSRVVSTTSTMGNEIGCDAIKLTHSINGNHIANDRR